MGEQVKGFITGLLNQLNLWLIELINAYNELPLTIKDFAKFFIVAANKKA